MGVLKLASPSQSVETQPHLAYTSVTSKSRKTTPSHGAKKTMPTTHSKKSVNTSYSNWPSTSFDPGRKKRHSLNMKFTKVSRKEAATIPVNHSQKRKFMESLNVSSVNVKKQSIHDIYFSHSKPADLSISSLIHKTKGIPRFETFGKKLKKRRKGKKDDVLDLTHNDRYEEGPETDLSITEHSLPPLDRSSQASSVAADSDYEDVSRPKRRGSAKGKKRRGRYATDKDGRNAPKERNQSFTFTQQQPLKQGNAKDRSKSLKKSSSKRKQNPNDIPIHLKNVGIKASLKSLKHGKAPALEDESLRSISNTSQRSNSRKNRFIRKTQSINSLKLLQENEELKQKLIHIGKTFFKFKQSIQLSAVNGGSGCVESSKPPKSNDFPAQENKQL